MLTSNPQAVHQTEDQASRLDARFFGSSSLPYSVPRSKQILRSASAESCDVTQEGLGHLVDFGLALSPRFALSDTEREFVSHHGDQDADYAAMQLVNWVVTTGCGIGMSKNGGPIERNAYARRCARGDIPHDEPARVAGILARYSPAAAAKNDFSWRLVDGDIDARYAGLPSMSRRG